MKSILFATALIAVMCVTGAVAIGCGEHVGESESCSDWQCSRNVGNFCVRGVDLNESCAVDGDCYLDMHCSNATKTCAKNAKGTKNPGVGFIGALVAVVCFGSSFVPIKRYKKFAGDGVFAQFCMCFGRFMAGVILLLTRENKQFYPMAALGGLFWSGGNAISVPIIQCIGMGLGIAIWGTTNMIIGWASGNFGLWGVKKETPDRPWLSYLSVAFSFVSIVLFLFVEPHHKKAILPQFEDDEKKNDSLNGENDQDDETTGMVTSNAAGSPTAETTHHHPTIADKIGKTKARVIGVTLALIAGALFGLCMDPAQHMMSNYSELTESTDTKYTPYGFDYVFSFNVGAISFSFIYLSCYMFMRMCGFCPTDKYFDRVEHEKIILPAFANGLIGSCGSAAWFFANQNLGLIVSFPIIGAGPGVVSALWGVFVFGEIKGARNYIVLVCAFCAVVAASLCSGFSKEH